jgi:hypothetical protein
MTRWNEKFEMSDAELGMDRHSPVEDLRTVLNVLPERAAQRLLAAFARDLVIRNHYVDSQGRRCLLGWLAGVDNKVELLNLPLSDTVGFAARRVVRYWDQLRITPGTVCLVLRCHLLSRAAARLQTCQPCPEPLPLPERASALLAV